jgi:hypothetical protein
MPIPSERNPLQIKERARGAPLRAGKLCLQLSGYIGNGETTRQVQEGLRKKFSTLLSLAFRLRDQMLVRFIPIAMARILQERVAEDLKRGANFFARIHGPQL